MRERRIAATPTSRALGLLLASLLMVPQTARAQHEPRSALTPRVAAESGLGRGNEYTSGGYAGEVLIQVKMLGAVERPGIYHLPKTTDLVTLVALAGGLRSDADPKDVTIKRRGQQPERIIAFDLDAYVRTPDVAALYLEADDVVLVAAREQPVSQETLTLVGFIASILSIIVTSLVLGGALTPL